MSKVVHFEIPTDNSEKSLKFYKDTFGWNYQSYGAEEYWLVEAGAADAPGINGAIMKRFAPGQPLTVHIGVASLEKTMADIEKNGGQIVVPKTEVPGMGAYAFFKDPDGNILGIWQQTQM